MRKDSKKPPVMTAATFEQDGNLSARESVLLLGAFFALAASLASFITL